MCLQIVLVPLVNLTVSAVNETDVNICWSVQTENILLSQFYFYAVVLNNSKFDNFTFDYMPSPQINIGKLQTETSYKFRAEVSLCRRQNNKIDCGQRFHATSLCGGNLYI